MAKSIDRRSTSDTKKDVAEDAAARVADTRANMDMTADYKLRRMGPGSRMMAQFFSHEHQLKPIKRGELLGLLEMLAYNAREAAWYRKLYRYLFRIPGPDDTWARMAHLFEQRVVTPAIEAMKQELAEERKELLARGRELLDEAKDPPPTAQASDALGDAP